MDLLHFVGSMFFFAAVKFVLPHTSERPDLYEYVQDFINHSNSYVTPKNNDAFFRPEDDCTYSTDFGTFDFIIVGGGTAGGVLANRLTEEKFDVLVIEAGKDEPLISEIVEFRIYLLNSDWNWGYETVPQSNACFARIEQRCSYPMGKALGGTSAINGVVFIRGDPENYNKWEKLGNTGWSYKHCLPYFKKSERAEFNIDIEPKYHGFDGVQPTKIVNDTPHMTTNLLAAFKELGMEERDFNGRTQNAISRPPYYLDGNIRASTDHSFIKPVLNRTNLFITLESLVTKIKIKHSRAYGVEFVRHGKKYHAKARNEVIVSAGTINSPQVLMLSGIGPEKELRKHGIDILADLPVGENLYDHVLLNIVAYRTKNVYYNITLKEQIELWKEGKRPLITAGQVIGFLNSEGIKANQLPDIGFYIHSLAQSSKPDYYGNEYTKGLELLNTLTDFVVATAVLDPKSFGSVKLQSSNPRDFPLINPNLFSDPRDLETMYKGIQFALKLNDTETFRKWKTTYLFIPVPACDAQHETLSKKWWYCVIRGLSFSIYHPIGTTRMGISPKDSVVNHELKVHGIHNLRVVDAGVIPLPISGHLNAPVVMIAEKIADAIKAEHAH